PYFTKYSASLRVQARERDETVKQLDLMISELLEEYQKANQDCYPENVIVFRDGVSEGQFAEAKRIELRLAEAAMKKRCGKEIKLTFIVTQKRHNTRFVADQIYISNKKPTWNVPSGTVVDTTIVDPKYKMFYLN